MTPEQLVVQRVYKWAKGTWLIILQYYVCRPKGEQATSKSASAIHAG